MTYHLFPVDIYQPHISGAHRGYEWGQAGFETLLDMQGRHFWHRGRHRFLLKALDRFMPKTHCILKMISFVIFIFGSAGGCIEFFVCTKATSGM